jgi:CRP/FNR family transcriptional regulator, cyclic AMP receptor protein
VPDNRESCLWYIKNLDFFPAMSDDEAVMCARMSKMVTARRGEVVALPDDTGHHAWLIKEGRVRLVRHTADGKSLAVDVLGPGEIIGELALVTGEPMPETAEAVEDALLCRVSGEFLRDLCQRNPSLGLQIAKRVGMRRIRIETRLSDLLFATVPVRVAKLLLQLSDRFGDGSLIDLRLTHQEIGELVGCNREAATRAVDHLLDQGRLTYEGRQIRISREALAAFAGNVSEDTALQV